MESTALYQSVNWYSGLGGTCTRRYVGEFAPAPYDTDVDQNVCESYAALQYKFCSLALLKQSVLGQKNGPHGRFLETG